MKKEAHLNFSLVFAFFLVVIILSALVIAIPEFSIDKLWSQVKTLYIEGHPHYFSYRQEKKFQRRNKKYQKLVPVEELAEMYLKKGNGKGSTTDIAIQLFRKAEVKKIPNKSEIWILGTWMKKPRRITTLPGKPNATNGRMTPKRLLISPSWRMIWRSSTSARSSTCSRIPRSSRCRRSLSR